MVVFNFVKKALPIFAIGLGLFALANIITKQDKLLKPLAH